MKHEKQIKWGFGSAVLGHSLNEDFRERKRMREERERERKIPKMKSTEPNETYMGRDIKVVNILVSFSFMFVFLVSFLDFLLAPSENIYMHVLVIHPLDSLHQTCLLIIKY